MKNVSTQEFVELAESIPGGEFLIKLLNQDRQRLAHKVDWLYDPESQLGIRLKRDKDGK